MDVDAGQYASISREMLQNHHYLEVLHRGQNYLDKPPLLFWLSALSFKIFGVSTFAYKLPSFLFTILGVYSTYRIGTMLYDRNTGILAALLLYTCQAFFLFNNDIRTDTILTSCVAFACWQLLLFTETKKIWALLAGFTGVAFAMMSKGPIGAIVPASAIFSHLAFRREWKKFLWWQWYAGILFSLLLLSPMLYGLYKQYGTAGPNFFFWTQSFGRITGENVWHNDAGYFYFIHNFLWSFLPWSLLGSFAVLVRLYELFSNRFRLMAGKEIFSLGGFVLPFIALSLSHYKLPHYIFVVYPLAAVLTAGFITQKIITNRKLFSMLAIVQLVISIGVVVLSIYLSSYIFHATNIFIWIVVGILAFLMVSFFIVSQNLLSRLILPSAIAVILVDFLFNVHVYPSLLKFQSGNELAKVAMLNSIPKNEIYFYYYSSHSFEFYFQTIVPSISSQEILNKEAGGIHFWVIGGEELINFLKEKNIQPKQVTATDDFPVTRLTLEFLNPNTRSAQLHKKYLVEL